MRPYGRGVPIVESSESTVVRSRIEIAACLLTGGLFVLLCEDATLKAVVIACAFVGWTAYVVLSARRDRRLVAEWGLGLTGLLPTLRVVVPITLAGTVGLAAAGAARGARIFEPHL